MGREVAAPWGTDWDDTRGVHSRPCKNLGVQLRLYVVHTDFEAALADPRNISEIHRDLRQGPGRRIREVALNRAMVVLTVAAWQAFLQDAARVASEILKPEQGEPQGGYRVLRALLLQNINTFSTPNAENTRDLLLHVGFDPWPAWHWVEGPVHLDPDHVRTRLNAWLRVRHAIAHGDDLPDVPMLAHSARGGRSLRLANAEACLHFFERLERTTVDGLAAAVR